MSLIERIDELRDDIRGNKDKFEGFEDDVQSGIDNAESMLSTDIDLDGLGWDWHERADGFTSAAESLDEIIGELTNARDKANEAAETAQTIADLIDELGEDEDY